MTPIANLSSDQESYVHTVPPNTNEEAYYAITYYIPNKTGPGEDFIDLRFLSGNALTQPILEDNRPPSHVTVFSVSTTSEDDGTGETELTGMVFLANPVSDTTCMCRVLHSRPSMIRV